MRITKFSYPQSFRTQISKMTRERTTKSISKRPVVHFPTVPCPLIRTGLEKGTTLVLTRMIYQKKLEKFETNIRILEKKHCLRTQPKKCGKTILDS